MLIHFLIFFTTSTLPIVTGGDLYCLQKEDGEKLWLTSLISCIHHPPRTLNPDDDEPITKYLQVEEENKEELKNFMNQEPLPSSIYLTVPEKLRLTGYPIEEHTFTTEDGYILTYHRIPYGKNDAWKHVPNKTPVLIQHGMFGHSGYWLTQETDKNLPHILADRGYDVWLGNGRGTISSQGHVRYPNTTQEYWDFGWEEMGVYDVAAGIDYILENTGKRQLHYVGHSMGTTMFYTLMALKPEYNPKIRLMISYAPIGWVFHMTSVIRYFSAAGFGPVAFIRPRAVFPEHIINHLQTVVGRKCDPVIAASRLCTNIMFYLFGFDYQQTNLTQFYRFMEEGFNPISFKILEHYAQGILWDGFHRYHLGYPKNCALYGSCNAPAYDMKKITAPVALFYGENDAMAAVEDVQHLVENLPNLVYNYKVPFPHWNHLDFLTAIDINPLLHQPTLDLLEKYL